MNVKNRRYKAKHLQINCEAEKILKDTVKWINNNNDGIIYEYEVIGIALKYLQDNLKVLPANEQKKLIYKYWRS